MIDRILLELSKPEYKCRLFKNNVGLAIALDGSRLTKYGTIGSADINGIIIGGKRIEIEVKTGEARQTKQQKAYQAMIEKYGGIYILARKLEDVVDEIKKHI